MIIECLEIFQIVTHFHLSLNVISAISQTTVQQYSFTKFIIVIEISV